MTDFFILLCRQDNSAFVSIDELITREYCRGRGGNMASQFYISS